MPQKYWNILQSGENLLNEMLTNENVFSSRSVLLQVRCDHKPLEDLVKMQISFRSLTSYKLPSDVHAAGPQTTL